MTETLIVAVASGLIVAAVIWAIKRFPNLWKASARAVERASEAAKAKKNEQAKMALRQRVRDRADELGNDLPWERDYGWKGPGSCIMYASGEKSYFINAYDNGIGQYEAALRYGKTPPLRTFATKAPKAVMTWTTDELEAWLADH